MKKNILTLILLSIAALSYGQAWLWAKNLVNNNNSSYSYVNSTAIDSSGSVYEAGFFMGSIKSGTYNFNTTHEDMLVTKFDSGGNVLWASGGTLPNYYSACTANSVAADKKGNSYVTGFFQDTITIGSQTVSTFSLSSDMFLAKYDPSGNVKWAVCAKLANKKGSVTASSVTVDNNGYVYVTGQFSDTVTFGAYTITEPQVNIFLVKYDSNGNVIWVRKTINSGGGQSYAITTDKPGNVYITGYYLDNITFFPYALSYHGDNVFLVKYDSSGAVKWVNSGYSNCGITSGYAVITDNSDNIYVTGTYTNTIMFSYFILPYFNGSNLFLVKYNSAGHLLWAKYPNVPLGSTENGYSLAMDKSNYLYMAGSFNDSITFGTLTLTSSAKNPSHLIKFDTAGNALCGTVINNCGATYVVSNPLANNIYESGNVGTVNSHPDSCVFGNDTVGSPGSGLSFLAKWQPCMGFLTGQSEVQSQDATINVFPNPSNGQFHFQVKITSYELGMKNNIEVYNMLGERIFMSSFGGGAQSAEEETIDLSRKPAGIYLYRVISESGNLVGEGKLIIE